MFFSFEMKLVKKLEENGVIQVNKLRKFSCQSELVCLLLGIGMKILTLFSDMSAIAVHSW